MLLSFWLKADLSRAWVGASWAFALLFALTARLGTPGSGTCARRETLAFRTVIVGTNDEAQRLLRIMQRPAFGFRPIGVVATDDRPRDLGVPLFGSIGELREILAGPRPSACSSPRARSDRTTWRPSRRPSGSPA